MPPRTVIMTTSRRGFTGLDAAAEKDGVLTGYYSTITKLKKHLSYVLYPAVMYAQRPGTGRAGAATGFDASARHKKARGSKQLNKP
ncbi:hypothetical protein A6M21_04045 [Desulfotomaculum copahuensis]|uniref:Uncharacterized protein n=1 Tax=Desulfotomaculum copahuensis TaxID=1838280 RepID=A0A1B7LI70_9FIRM|nr:hypothetical protein A6M21_04045 [Desulfotomaculum copahuensis]